MLDIVATERPLIFDPRVAVQIIDANKRKLKERMAELEKETETKEECVCVVHACQMEVILMRCLLIEEGLWGE